MWNTTPRSKQAILVGSENTNSKPCKNLQPRFNGLFGAPAINVLLKSYASLLPTCAATCADAILCVCMEWVCVHLADDAILH